MDVNNTIKILKNNQKNYNPIKINKIKDYF